MPERRAGTAWLWAFAPVNASTGIFLTLLPIYILNKGGSVIDVGIITSAYLSSLIPASLVWGYAVDIFPYRKGYVAFSYLGMGMILALISLFSDPKSLSMSLALYGFVSAAAAPAVNLLIMESFPKSSWPDAIARLSLTSMVGYDAGIVAGFLWSSFYRIDGLIVLSGLLSPLSGLLALRFVPKPKIVFERKTILFSREVFAHRLLTLPILLLSLPRLRDFRRFVRMLKLTFLREVPLLYFSVFIFNIGANIYGTSYVPALKQRYISDNAVFLITLANTITQTIVFYYIHKKMFFQEHMAVDTTRLILGVRGGIFLATAILVILFQGNLLLATNMVTFALLGGSWAFYSTAVSSMVFKTLDSQRQGEILGIYSAVGGAFSFAGALVSGYISSSLGYPVTFSIAAVLMTVSLFLLNLSAKIGERIRLLHDIITYG